MKLYFLHLILLVLSCGSSCFLSLIYSSLLTFIYQHCWKSPGLGERWVLGLSSALFTCMSCTRRNPVPSAHPKIWGFHPGTWQQSGYCRLTRAPCDAPRKRLPRASLTNCQSRRDGWCCRQHNVCCSVLRLWTSCHVWRTGSGGGTVSDGVLWRMPIRQRRAVLWAQVPGNNVGSSRHLFLTVWSETCTGSLLEVTLQGSGSASPVASCTKKQILVLLGPLLWPDPSLLM